MKTLLSRTKRSQCFWVILIWMPAHLRSDHDKLLCAYPVYMIITRKCIIIGSLLDRKSNLNKAKSFSTEWCHIDISVLWAVPVPKTCWYRSLIIMGKIIFQICFNIFRWFVHFFVHFLKCRSYNLKVNTKICKWTKKPMKKMTFFKKKYQIINFKSCIQISPNMRW